MPTFSESIVIDGRRLYSVEQQFVVRDARTHVAFADIESNWLTVTLRDGRHALALPDDAKPEFSRVDGHAALTLVLDVSSSMLPARDSNVHVATELLLALRDDDLVRIIALSYEVRSTEWHHAAEFRAGTMLTYLRGLARSERMNASVPCLDTHRSAVDADVDATWGDWLSDCDAGQQREIERVALERYFGSLTAGTARDAAWSHCPPPPCEPMAAAAMDEVLAGLLPDVSGGLAPALGASLALVVTGDSGSCLMNDPVHAPALDALLVQRWCLHRSGTTFGLGDGAISAPLPAPPSAAALAREIVAALHSTWSLRLESTEPRIADRKALEIRCARPLGPEVEVISPAESLPPLEVLVAAWEQAASSGQPVDVGRFVRSLGIRSESVRSYIAAAAPGLMAAPRRRNREGERTANE